MNTQRYFIINDYIIFNENLNEHSQFNHRLGVNSKKYYPENERKYVSQQEADELDKDWNL